MTLTIQLSPEEERRLHELAAERGQPVEDFAHDVLGRLLGNAPINHSDPENGSHSRVEREWITAEEVAAEWDRIRRSGLKASSPEYQRLLERVGARDSYIWETFGPRLMERFPGKWAAIAPGGEFEIADSQVEALRRARERFGDGGACVVCLTPDRGESRLRPRKG